MVQGQSQDEKGKGEEQSSSKNSAAAELARLRSMIGGKVLGDYYTAVTKLVTDCVL
jgi:hypothetical protein